MERKHSRSSVIPADGIYNAGRHCVLMVRGEFLNDIAREAQQRDFNLWSAAFFCAEN